MDMGNKGEKNLDQYNEAAELQRLYDEIYDAQLFVREFMWNTDKFGAAVGAQQDLVEALGLKSVDDITSETIAELPMFIPFAMPGSGATRVDAVRDAYTQMSKELEKREKVALGERTPGSVYGTFMVGQATVTAYLPDQAPDNWTVTIEREGEDTVTETLPMDYAPVFGPDVSDVAALNEFVEVLISKYELE